MERFLSIKNSYETDGLLKLQKELENFLDFLEKDNQEKDYFVMYEVRDLLNIIRFIIECRFTNDNDSYYSIVDYLIRRLIDKRNRNIKWKTIEVRYINIILGAYPKLDELIELANYTKKQMKYHFYNDEINEEEYKKLPLVPQANMVNPLFNNKFKFLKNYTYIVIELLVFCGI